MNQRADPTPGTSRPALAPVLRVLRICLHLLMAALLVLVMRRAFTDGQPHTALLVAAAVVMAIVYFVGPTVPRIRRSRPAAAAWLAVLTACWLVLLLLSPTGVWVAFPLFFLQLHLLSLRHGLVAVTLTTAVAVTGFAWHQDAVTPGGIVGPALGAAVAVATVLGYQALYRESENRRLLIEELTTARSELAAADRHAGVLAERERLAREIHDTLAQGLSSIQLLLRAAERDVPPESAAAGHVERARRTAQDNLAEARRFVRALAPPDLEGGSLSAALERLCADTTAESGTQARFHTSGSPDGLPTPYEVALLRIAQSALANTVRHAGASRVEVTLSYMDTRVALDVVDDGQGFDPDTVPTTTGGAGFGIAAMRARVRALGGSMTVESAPGQGTALAVSLVRPSAQDAEGSR